MPYKSPKSKGKAKTSGFHSIALWGVCNNQGFQRVIKSITELNKSPTLICQAVNGELVLGEEQARHACLLAMNAFMNKENRANRKELEFILWISGKRQLDKAIAAFGLKGRPKEVLVVCASTKSDAEASKASERICREIGLQKRPAKGKSVAEEKKAMGFYGINKKMIESFPEAKSKAKRKEAIERLCLEKMALLALDG